MRNTKTKRKTAFLNPKRRRIYRINRRELGVRAVLSIYAADTSKEEGKRKT